METNFSILLETFSILQRDISVFVQLTKQYFNNLVAFCFLTCNFIPITLTLLNKAQIVNCV